MMVMVMLLSFIVVIISLSVHEFMHGLIAYREGDMTAKHAGRLTLNPIAHIDLFGTILLPLLLRLMNLPAFGWAKPVPYDPTNMRDRHRSPIFVALAGPASNLTLFFVSALALKMLSATLPPNNLLLVFLFLMATVNAALALFNIIPIPPLDGSKLLLLFAGRSGAHRFLQFIEQQGIWILMLYFALGMPGLSWAFEKLIITAGLLPYYALYSGMI